MLIEKQKESKFLSFPNKRIMSDYIDLVVDFLEILSPDIIIERFFSESPEKMLIYPKYGLKNYEVKSLVVKRLVERDTYQGRLFIL